MSMASNVVLFSDQGEPDWVARTRYYSNPVDPNDPDDIAVDGNGNVAVAVSGSPGFGIQSYNKYAGLTSLRITQTALQKFFTRQHSPTPAASTHGQSTTYLMWTYLMVH